MKQYIRDKRSPTPKNLKISELMSSNKAQNTEPELILRKALWHYGFRGYRLNYKRLPGSPDIVFIKNHLAIFVNGCFWHRCPHCNLPVPKNNKEFWSTKFERNITRDIENIKKIELLGWRVLVIWECEIKKNLDEYLLKIVGVL